VFTQKAISKEENMVDQTAMRRRRTVVLATAAAAALAGGAFVTVQMHDTKPESLPEPPPTPIAAVTPTESASTATTDSVPTAVTTPPKSEPTPSAKETTATPAATHTTKTSAKVQQEIKKAQAKAAADGYPVQRPVEAKADTSAVDQWTEPIKNGTVRITTAHRDLTGDATLAVAGDRGKSVGSGVSCTDKVRFSRDAPATEHKTLLLCWKTSATRSVVTMMATPSGQPSAAASVALISKEWAKLG
jgi:hypothetical protein